MAHMSFLFEDAQRDDVPHTDGGNNHRDQVRGHVPRFPSLAPFSLLGCRCRMPDPRIHASRNRKFVPSSPRAPSPWSHGERFPLNARETVHPALCPSR